MHLTTALASDDSSALKGKADSIVSITEDSEEPNGMLPRHLKGMDCVSSSRKAEASAYQRLQERFSWMRMSIKTAIRDGVLTEQVKIRDRLLYVKC